MLIKQALLAPIWTRIGLSYIIFVRGIRLWHSRGPILNKSSKIQNAHKTGPHGANLDENLCTLYNFLRGIRWWHSRSRILRKNEQNWANTFLSQNVQKICKRTKTRRNNKNKKKHRNNKDEYKLRNPTSISECEIRANFVAVKIRNGQYVKAKYDFLIRGGGGVPSAMLFFGTTSASPALPSLYFACIAIVWLYSHNTAI